MHKKFISICLIFVLLFIAIPYNNINAETVYLGGSSNIGEGGTSGTSGNHSVVLPEGFPMALRLSIQVQKPGDFAEQGYENSYPVSFYSLVLVPSKTPDIAKTRNVLASKGYGVCDYVTDHPAVVLNDDADSPIKKAVWELFMGKKSDIYRGDATALIGSGLTVNYESLVPTELFVLDAGIPASDVDSAGGMLYVSTEEIPKEDRQKQIQMTLAGITLGKALQEQGQNLDLPDMAKYFLGEVSENEYIVIIENMLACRDTANDSLGYWWTLSNTAISQLSGHDVIPEEYSGTTGKYLENVCVNKIKYKEGENKQGYIAASGNRSQQYLFNYWFTPTYNNNWSPNIAVSSLYYSRGDRNEDLDGDGHDEVIWKAQYEHTDPNDLTTGKFGFNVLICFASGPTPPHGGEGMHQLYSTPEVIHAKKLEEVKADQYIDFVQYEDTIKEDIANTIYDEYMEVIKHDKENAGSSGSDEKVPIRSLFLSRIDYTVNKQGDEGKFNVEKSEYELNLPIHTFSTDQYGNENMADKEFIIEDLINQIGEFTDKWEFANTTGTFEEAGTYIWEYYSAAEIVAYAGATELKPVSLKTSYAKTIIIIENDQWQYLRWYNQPLGFAEVKEGTWSGDRSTEKWEAMAGVPTTETLYINAGGTPVFCDIKAKYTETSFVKTYHQSFSHRWMVSADPEKWESETCEITNPITFNFSYITIESVTLRTAEKAILNNAKIFVEEHQEVPIIQNIKYSTDGENRYYNDKRGTDKNNDAYGILSEEYSWSDKSELDDDPRHAATILQDHLKEIEIFRNSDKVTIYIEGEKYEILVGASDVATVNETHSLTVDISEQWKPTEPNGTYIWDKYNKIPFIAYKGDPQAGEDRNVTSPECDEKLRFYKEGVEIPLNQVNGYYSFEDRANEQYMQYSNAFGLIKESLNSEPDEPPILEYVDYKSPIGAPYTLEQVDGPSVNPIVIHDPVSAQDCWIHNVSNNILQDQRIERDQYDLPKTYIDYQFYFTIPNGGSFEVNEAGSNTTDLTANSLLKVVDNPGELGKSFVGKYNLAFNEAPRDLNYPENIPDANNLDTSLWIRAKYAKLPFNAYYDGKLYQKGTWITLYDQGRDTPQTDDPINFKIYITSDNGDIANAVIYYVSEAINAPEDLAGQPEKLYAEAEKNANTLRDKTETYKDLDGDVVKKLSARPSASYTTKQDVIGRIGNVIIDDSTDQRFTNVFWQPDTTKPMFTGIYWPLIQPGGKFYSLYFNMFEEVNSNAPMFDSRWGTLNDYHDAAAYRQGEVPVTNLSNPTPGYTAQAIRMGYPVQFSIQTLGSYGDGIIRITPHYLYANPHTDLATDNIYLFVQDGFVYNRYYDATQSIDADTAKSFEPTQRIVQMHSLKNARAKINEVEKGTPSYINATNVNQTALGTPSYLEIPTELRTYIGSTKTTGTIGDGDYDHDGNTSNENGSWTNAQRWHASLYLPSSTRAMEIGGKEFLDTTGSYLVTYMKFETSNNSSPWQLELKTNNANDGFGNPTKPETTLSTDINAYGPTENVVYPTPPTATYDKPKPEIPVIVFDVDRTSAKDSDIVGTH